MFAECRVREKCHPSECHLFFFFTCFAFFVWLLEHWKVQRWLALLSSQTVLNWTLILSRPHNNSGTFMCETLKETAAPSAAPCPPPPAFLARRNSVWGSSVGRCHGPEHSKWQQVQSPVEAAPALTPRLGSQAPTTRVWAAFSEKH